jgi:hypothetical protein
VDERFGVDVLNAGNELVREQKHSLQRELPVAEVEQVLQAGSEKVQDHSIIITLCAEPTDKGNTNPTSKGLVDSGFVFELGMLSFDALELDSNFFAGDDVGAYVDS